MNKLPLAITTIIALVAMPLCMPAIAKPAATATIYGKSFYPSEYIPDMTVYARNVKTKKTYSVKVPGTMTYKMILPAPATYIFFSWTDEPLGQQLGSNESYPVGAVLSTCDGSSQEICEGHKKHIAKPISLKPGQTIKDLQIANYYYPTGKMNYYVPKP